MKIFTILLYMLFTLISISSKKPLFKANEKEIVEVDQNISDLGGPSLGGYLPHGVSSSDNNLTDVNIVNYELAYERINYENFNQYEYMPRSVRSNDDNLSEIEQNHVDTINPQMIDNRTLVNDPKDSEHIKTAFIESKYRVYNNSINAYETLSFRSTGFLVGRNLVLTAGHCAYSDKSTIKNGIEYEDNETNPKFANYMTCSFGASGKSECYTDLGYEYRVAVKKINIEYSYYLNNNMDRDWALLELVDNIGDDLGYYSLASNYRYPNFPTFSYGYPGDKAGYNMWRSSGTVYESLDYIYKSNMYIYGGQSGSPCITVMSNGTKKVVGIVTSIGLNNECSYATIIDSFIYNFVYSFSQTRSTSIENDYLSLKIDYRMENGWSIIIRNTSSRIIDMEYNEFMCFYNDARDWTHLHDQVQMRLKPYETRYVEIYDYLFATSITASYIQDNQRIITYANNLASNGSLNVYHNAIYIGGN